MILETIYSKRLYLLFLEYSLHLLPELFNDLFTFELCVTSAFRKWRIIDEQPRQPMSGHCIWIMAQ